MQELSPQRYYYDISPQVWSAFFKQFTDDNQGRRITLKILDHQQGDFEVLSHHSLFSVVYEPPDYGNDLVVTVSRILDVREITYSHAIVYPQVVQVSTNENGIVQTCTITDDDHAQTIIYFD